MATKLLTMNTTALGCIASTQIASLSAADVASLEQAIVNDAAIYPQNPNTAQATVQIGTFVSGTGVSTQLSLTSVTLTSGPPLTSTTIGDFINGQGIAPGTTVTSVSGSGTNFTLGLSQPLVASRTAGTFLVTQTHLPGCYQTNGWLTIPGRGQLKVLPGDVVGVDPTGWPILLSYASITAPGSIWVLV